MRTHKPWLLLSVCAAALSACAVGEEYQLPSLTLPTGWHSDTPTSAQEASIPSNRADWWQSFGDPVLDGLMVRALAGNHSRQMMQARVLEARGGARSVGGNLWPMIGAGGTATRYNLGEQTFDKRFSYYQAGFDASYELDFFGGNRRRAEAADANAEAADAEYADATLTLTAEVARHYVQWRQYQRQAELATEAAKAEETLLSFAKAKHAAKIISDAEFAQAEAHALTVQSAAPQLEAARDATGYQLSVLLGENPGALNDELKEMKPIPEAKLLPVLAAPAEVIARRPDIKAAERQLAATTAMQGAALAQLFPKLSLSAFYGVQDSVMFGSNPIWALASSIVMPVIDFGRIRGQIDVADARQVQAMHAYQETVLKALAEIETALTNVGKEGKRAEALSNAAADAEKNLKLMEAQQKQGVVATADVLMAKQQWIELAQQAASSRAALAQDVIALYKALAITNK